jgi:phospholipase/carboxylesterase
VKAPSCRREAPTAARSLTLPSLPSATLSRPAGRPSIRLGGLRLGGLPPCRYGHAVVPSAPLASLTRPAEREPEGALVLFHGRGADERDLFPLLDVLDPGRRLLGVTPRGPLSLPPGGAHWYRVREIGYPDQATFTETFSRTSKWLDELVEESGIPIERAVLGGFSQGAVMTWALGLADGRPRPAGLIALSGFVPTVEGFDLDLARPLPPVVIGHGTLDPVISVEWSRRAREQLEEAGAGPTYRESPNMGHSIDPVLLRELPAWLELAVPSPA